MTPRAACRADFSWVHVKLLQSFLTFCDSISYSLPGSSARGILLVRILEWVAMPFSRGSSQLRDQTHVSYVSCIGRQVLLTLVPPGKPLRVKAN